LSSPLLLDEVFPVFKHKKWLYGLSLFVGE